MTVLVGLFALFSEPGRLLEHWSFDFPTLFNRSKNFPELVLIEMDEPSHRELQQDHGAPWDRELHARLVDYLREDGARQLVFDVEFSEKSTNLVATANLAHALQRHGQVVLGASLSQTPKKGFGFATFVRQPLPELLGPGVAWGVSWDLPGPIGEDDGIVRLHPQGRDPDVSLPWAAAMAVNPGLTNRAGSHNRERWVHHYGPSDTLPRVSYWQATNELPGFYRGRTVFIGGRPATGFNGEAGDQFRTAWSRWNHPAVSGLELTATAWLNLVRGDWITRLSPHVEFLLLLCFGTALGGAVAISSVRRSFLISAALFVVVFLAAIWLFRVPRIWGNWAVAAFIEVPVALGWRLIRSHLELRREKRWLEAPLEDLFADPAADGTTRVSTTTRKPAWAPPTGAAVSEAGRSAGGAPSIPDFELLRCVGRGAYGDVWLARDIMGGFRVVKIVRRVAFDDDAPYEREFRGLQKFAPISREHAGVVQILHAGLNRAGGFFHYVMEAGDDEQSAREIDPERYTPRNLGRDLRRNGPLRTARTAELGIALCDAVAFLHERGLIHRDIKPANVIYIDGRPKLADIGLVTELASRAHGVTQVGTAGYIPPEGLGTAAGDIFALGRLLAETLDPSARPDDEGVAALRRILEQAHAVLPEDRFPGARALGAALVAWRNKYLPATEESVSIRP